jgi:hypothetical protein
MTKSSERSRPLSKGPLRFAPRNENGVVFLFAYLAPRLRLRVESIQPAFPDCIAYRSTGRGERRLRIEFEFRSSSFRSHRHDPRKCDVIVCWAHDWLEKPRRLEVIELRRYFAHEPQVWIQPAIRSQQENFDRFATMEWAVSPRAYSGDLLLMYRCAPVSAITDIYVLSGDLERSRAGWRPGTAIFGNIRRLLHLPSPIFLEDLRHHRVLKTASFVRRNMQGNLHRLRVLALSLREDHRPQCPCETETLKVQALAPLGAA